MSKVQCDGCFDKFDEDALSEVSYDGREQVRCCPRCVFIVALYHELGIKKEWVRGGIHPSVVSSNIRKIVEKEFYKDPHGTYKKYLGAMIERQEFDARVVHVEPAVIEKINDFPFVFLPVENVNRYRFEQGVDVTLDAGDLKLKRKLYGFTVIKGKYLKKYGRRETSAVLFLPEVYDADSAVA